MYSKKLQKLATPDYLKYLSPEELLLLDQRVTKSPPAHLWSLLAYRPNPWSLAHLHTSAARFNAFATSRQVGKCGVPETRVTMADGGWKRLDQIEIGDLVMAFSEDGGLRPQKVAAVIDNGIKEVVKVTTRTGRSVVVTKNHPFWTTRGWVDAGDLQPTTGVSPTSHGVRDGDVLPWPAAWPETPSTMDEETGWLLGLLVGDGGLTQESVRVTVSDDNIVLALANDHANVGYTLRHVVGFDYALNGAKKFTRAHGIHGKGAYDKSVPRAVFAGGPEAWRGFLAGYLDADGTVDHHLVEYYSVSRELLEGVRELLSRFGITSTLAVKNGHYQGDVHKSFRLTIGGKENLSIFVDNIKPRGNKLGKLEAQTERLSAKRPNGRGARDHVVSVKVIGMRPTIGLEIENDHTHITDTLMTHNTTSLIYEILDALFLPPRDNDQTHQRDAFGKIITRNPNLVGVVSDTFEHAELVVFPFISLLTKLFGESAFSLNKNAHVLTMNPDYGSHSLRWFSADSPRAGQGHTFSSLFVDEAQNVSDDFWVNTRPALGARMAQVFACGTPDPVMDSTWFQGMFINGQDTENPDYYSYSIPCTLNKWLPAADVRDALYSLSEEEFRMKYLGQWVNREGAVFKNIDACFTGGYAPYDASKTYSMGLDLAKSMDFTVAYVIDTTSKAIVARERINGIDWTKIAEKVTDLYKRYHVRRVRLDSTGPGAVVADMLRHQQGLRVVDYTFTNKSVGQLVATLAREIEHNRIIFPREDTQLMRELKAFGRRVSKAGNVQYGAPEGAHDDCVYAAALACLEARNSGQATFQSYWDR